MEALGIVVLDKKMFLKQQFKPCDKLFLATRTILTF